MSRAELVYASASTNRYSQAADAVGSGSIAYGSGKLIAVWDATDSLDRGVFSTLPGHDGAVTCVSLAREDLIISADDKGVMKLWKNGPTQWDVSSTEQAHKSGVSCLAVNERFVVTGASDGTVKVWTITQHATATVNEVQEIKLNKGFPISLAVAELPSAQTTMLAIGSTDRKIYLWTSSEQTFVAAATLQGHEDWVRCLAFKLPDPGRDALVLASGSQDATIRLWNIEPFMKPTLGSNSGSTEETTDDLLDAFEASLVNMEDTDDGGRQISLKRHILTVKSPAGGSRLFSVTFDALLVGHEAGVTSLSWRPEPSPTTTPTLLSTSTDSSLILWSPSTVITSSTEGTALWINRQRFGDVGGQRLGGFVGGLWARNGAEAMAWGWNGGWRRWRTYDSSRWTLPTSEQGRDETPAESTLEEWFEVSAITGHRAPVRSVAWSPHGEYLISASLDQTTRIHGAVPVPLGLGLGETAVVWHEIARPQVHGYDLVGAAFLDALRFVSVADEKVARAFEAPREFVELVNNLGVAQLDTGEEARPRAATVPPLGLSNKALSDVSAVAEASAVTDGTRTQRIPFEGELAAITLWPETEKVFGHGYESIALAVSNNKQYVATACKATTAEHAVVRVYDARTWQPVGQPLSGHNLTVTQIAFSPNDALVLTVSRDRTWRLFEKIDEDGYLPVAADKSHARIIWDCAWAPEGDVFATASRDKTVKVWRRPAESHGPKWTAVATIPTAAAATAVAFAPDNPDSPSRTMAVGLESGQVLIHTSPRGDPSRWNTILTIGTHLAHIDHIHRLAWRPRGAWEKDPRVHQLASCGEDGTLKLLTVHIAAE